MQEIINIILENWESILSLLAGLIGVLWGVGASVKVKRWIKDVEEIIKDSFSLIETFKEVLEDKKLTKEEIKLVKKDIYDIKEKTKKLF